MNSSKAPNPIHEADYEAIETALLQSARGRWFLSEYASRSRSGNTRMLLEAMTKLETTVMQPAKKTEIPDMRRELAEMAQAISQTRSEIAAMRPEDVDDSKFDTATEELDAIIETTEKATSEILTAAEEVQETAWEIRDNGGCEQASDRLDALATDIYTACSFQDLTGQRTTKVVQTLRFLENRVLAMIEIWGFDELDTPVHATEEQRADSHLLNGPARRGEGIDQSQVDLVIDFDKDVGVAAEEGPGAQTPDDETETTELTAPASVPPQSGELAGEVEADAFSTPEMLDIEGLDGTKKQVLFN